MSNWRNNQIKSGLCANNTMHTKKLKCEPILNVLICLMAMILQPELHLLSVSILHHTSRASTPPLLWLYMSCSLLFKLPAMSFCCLLQTAALHARRQPIDIPPSVSGEPGVTSEITTTRPVCTGQSLNPSRVLGKLNAKRSFTTTQRGKSTELVELIHR